MRLLENFQSFIQSAQISQQPFGAMYYGINPRIKKKVNRRTRRKNHQKNELQEDPLTNYRARRQARHSH